MWWQRPYMRMCKEILIHVQETGPNEKLVPAGLVGKDVLGGWKVVGCNLVEWRSILGVCWGVMAKQKGQTWWWYWCFCLNMYEKAHLLSQDWNNVLHAYASRINPYLPEPSRTHSQVLESISYVLGSRTFPKFPRTQFLILDPIP